MIDVLAGFPDNVLAIAASGRITRRDYDDVLIPQVKAAFERLPKIRFYGEIGPQFAGIDAGAAWEDFRIGVGHLGRWERVAVVTDVAWIRLAMHALSFLFPSEVRLFGMDEAAAARSWISAA